MNLSPNDAARPITLMFYSSIQLGHKALHVKRVNALNNNLSLWTWKAQQDDLYCRKIHPHRLRKLHHHDGNPVNKSIASSFLDYGFRNKRWDGWYSDIVTKLNWYIHRLIEMVHKKYVIRMDNHPINCASMKELHRDYFFIFYFFMGSRGRSYGSESNFQSRTLDGPVLSNQLNYLGDVKGTQEAWNWAAWNGLSCF